MRGNWFFACLDCAVCALLSNNLAVMRGTLVASSKSLDRVARRILDELQGDARVSNQELAMRVGLSPAPCWRRLRRLEVEGFIVGYATLLNGPAKKQPNQAYTLV